MKYFIRLANAVLFTLLATQSLHAQPDDIASNQVVHTLDQGGAWISGAAPVSTNLATWSGTYTAANCTNNLAANATWGGIAIDSVTGAPIDIKTANSSILTLDGIASGATLDTIDLSAATVDLTVGCEVYIGGGATNSFTVASGRTFTYAGSSALFFSFATGSSPAVLSLNGAGNYIFNGPLDTYVRLSGEANWPVFVMNGTGVCTLNSTGHAMNFALNSGTLDINNIYAVSGYSGQTLTINGGTVDNTSGSEINIGNSSNNPIYDWDGNFAYGGTGALDLGPGTVTLGQNVQLTCNGSSTLTVDGAIGDGGSGYSLTKAGAGTLLLTGSSTYTGNTVINAGTLALGSSASLAAGSSVSIAAGAILDVSAISSYTLGSSAGLTASGTGTGSSTAAAINGSSGGTVSLGSRPITLTYNGSQPALYISQGTLVLDGNAFTINGSALSAGSYTLVEQASGNISSSGSYTASGTALGSGSGTISVSGGNVTLTISGGGGGGGGSSDDIASNQVVHTLDQGGAWISGAAPVSTNLATWSGTYTAANCTNNLAANATWGGIAIDSVTGAPIDIKTANSSILTLDGIASGATLDTIDLSAATVDLTVGCEVYIGGGATNSFTVASGRTFTYAGSSALFFSFATGSSPAVLSLNGAGNYIFNGPLDTYVRLSGEANWPVFVMNGTGVCTLNSTGHAMNFALNSGTLDINNIYAVSGYSGQTLTINGGTVDNTSGSEINIGNSSNNPIYDWDGNFAYGGTGALDLGPGTVTLGQNVQLTCNGSSTLTVDGAIGDGGSGYSLTKAGAGTLLLTGSSTYTGNTVINAGTLALGSSASLAAGSSVSIAAGAILDVSAISSYTLGSSAGLTASGTGTGSSTAAAINGSSGGTVSLGSRPITLTYNGSQPALYISQGTLVLDGNAFTINGSALSAGSYTLVEQASGNISSSGSYTASGTALGSGSGTISVSGGNVTLTISGGGSQSTTTSLSRTTGSSSQTYGSALTFTATVAGQTTSPSGSVVFKDGSTALFTNTLTAGTSPDSSATYTSYIALGVNGGTAHSIAAYYLGDGTHNTSSSSSSPVSQTITAKAMAVSGLTANNKTYDGTTAATLSGTAALSSPEAGGSGTTSDGTPYTGDTVSVTGTPTGTFASSSVGNNISVSVTGLSLTGTQAGDYSLTEPSLSADITATNTSSSTSLSLTSSSQTNAYQIPVAFRVTVLANGLPAANATGSVTFLTNGTVFCTGSLVNGTIDTPYVSDLPLGVNTITARYTGDGTYPGSTNTLDQVVMQQSGDATFSNSLMAISFNSSAGVDSIIREDTGENKNFDSVGFYIKDEQISEAAHAYFSSMLEISTNVMLFSTSDGKYNVMMGVAVENRYMKFSLLNVSDCASGGIDTNWAGLSVAFSIYPFYGGDPKTWEIYAVGLDPMEDILSTVDPVSVIWPYVQYSQVNAAAYPYIIPNSQNTNDLQPMGSLAIYSATNAAQHDDILYDIWGGEPSLPEPNRANLTNGWNRTTAQAWVTNWLNSLPPTKLLFLTPNDLTDLYSAADIMYSYGLNQLYLFNYYWEGDAVDAINTNLFPNGLSDMTTFEEYCAARGISLDLHASSAWVSYADPTYGAMSSNGVSPGVARWATGTLLTSINNDSTSFNVQPDPGCQLMIDPPPWGNYDLGSALPLADDYPPYYPAWFSPVNQNNSLLNIGNDLILGSVMVVNPTNWLVYSVNRTGVSQFGSYWGESHMAGSHVDFMISAYGANFIPDSRSEVLTNLGVRFATLLNEEHVTEANYDALEQQQDLGNWGPRRFSKSVYETLDHPVHSNSSFGTAPWGHFEYNFDSVQQHDGGPGFQVESSEAAPAAQVRIWDPSQMATHLDEDQFCFGLQASYCANMAIGGYHVGTSVNTITNQGWWSQVVTNLNLWQSLAPYLTTNEQAALRSFGPDFYVPTQSGGGWDLMPTRAMLRDGLDAPWQLMTESGPISPHQFMQVGDTLDSLTNPYTAQTPQIELLVLPGMTATNPDNISLLPDGAVNITTSQPFYNWHPSPTLNMGTSRGVAITVTGDGSGADLVFNIGGNGSYPPIGGRYYAVTVNFTGTETIEIPNGEVEWNRATNTGYGYPQSQNIGTFSYANAGSIGSFSLFLGYVPSGANPSIQVSSLQAMQEDQTTGLVNPTLTLNGESVSISGTIPYNDYVVYGGGSTASVYDANWNFLTTLPVSGSTLTAENGLNSFSVSAPDSPNAWMAVRVKVSGSPWVISP